MSKPRVFISSTCSDLQHIRSSLASFVKTLGFEPILSEKGNIVYSHDISLDKSCYREVEDSVDIFLLIIGKRYGSKANADSGASDGKGDEPHDFYDRYDSVTKTEFEKAQKKDIQTYTLIDKDVYSEHTFYLTNKGNEGTIYSHADSINIFEMIEEIHRKPRNNAIYAYEGFSDIESWLREQFAGLFKVLLDQKGENKQISDLASQIDDLKGVNNTLKTYLEAVMKKTEVEDSKDLIEDEEKRVEELEIRDKIRENNLARSLKDLFNISYDVFIPITREAKSFDDFSNKVDSIATNSLLAKSTLTELFSIYPISKISFNEARVILGLEPFEIPEEEPPSKPTRKRTKKKT